MKKPSNQHGIPGSQTPPSPDSNGLRSTVFSLHSLGLAFLQLEDGTAQFADFLEARLASGARLDCAALFPHCMVEVDM